MTFLLDTHGHYDFLPASARAEFLSTLHGQGARVVAQTVLPSEFVALEADLMRQAAEAGAQLALPLPSLGFHPWYIGADADEQLEIFAQAVWRTRLIGEIGLDFGQRRIEAVPAERQERVFMALLDAVSQAAGEGQAASRSLGYLVDRSADTQAEQTAGHGHAKPQERGELGSYGGDTQPFVLSIHAVRSAGRVLDVLSTHQKAARLIGAQRIVPIIHWFSGTSQELSRLMELGGCISVNAHMLKSKRGRAYIKQVPADRLFLETDLPEGREAAGASAVDSESSLGGVCTQAGGTSAQSASNPAEAGPQVAGASAGDGRGRCTEIGGPDSTSADCEDSDAAHGHAQALKIARTLTETLTAVSELRGEDMREAVLANQRRLYGEYPQQRSGNLGSG